MEGLEWLASHLRALFEAYPRLHDWIPVYCVGSIISLFKSFYDPKRRSSGLLFVEAFFGGVCAVAAYDASGHSIPWTIGAAVASGWLVQGINTAGAQFAAKPLDVFERVWKTVQPVFFPPKDEPPQPEVLPPPADIPPDMQEQLDELDRVTGPIEEG